MTADRDLANLPPQRALRGWKEIANYLEVSVMRAQERAKWLTDPLPVMHDHRGVIAYETALRDWVARTRMAYKAHLWLNRSRIKLPEPAATDEPERPVEVAVARPSQEKRFAGNRSR